MDGEYREGWDWTEYETLLREETIAWKVDKAVRERRVWLAAAAELRETEEVKRTGPASPAPCLQGRKKGEDVELCLPGTTREDREHKERSERSDLSHLWGTYRSYGVVMGGAVAGGVTIGGTPKTARRARRQGARSQAGAKGEATRQERGGNGSAGGAQTERSSLVADSGRSGLATEAADAECWLCGRRGCDCEASTGVQCEGSCSAPVTPEQRTISVEQVTPERTGGAEREFSAEFSLGSAAIEERSERTREVGTQMQTAKGPTADRERTRMTNADEIQELEACVEELQAQVLGAGRLAAMVADWTVASPGATVREIQRKDTQCRGAGRLKARRARDKADRLTAIARKATADANAAEAAAEMRDRAAEMAAVRRKEHAQKRAGRIKKATATTTTMDTTITTSTSVEERRAAVDRISKQIDVKHSEDRNSTVTSCELEKYRTKNRPWD